MCVCFLAGAHLEMSKPSVSPDKEARRPFSPPTPVPPQPLKSQPLPCVAPKPYVPPPQAKYPPQPNPPQRCLSTPDAPKSPATPSSPSKTPLTCSPFPSRTASEKPVLRAPGLPGQTPPSQRNLPPTTLAQDEPPWMALAKKKAKAWSEMPQIVQWQARSDLEKPRPPVGPERLQDGAEPVCTQISFNPELQALDWCKMPSSTAEGRLFFTPSFLFSKWHGRTPKVNASYSRRIFFFLCLFGCF